MRTTSADAGNGIMRNQWAWTGPRDPLCPEPCS